MSDNLKTCPFCGKDCHKTTLCMHDEALVECNNQKCAMFGRIMKASTWNNRAEPEYKYATYMMAYEVDTSFYEGSFEAGFNAARELKEK